MNLNSILTIILGSLLVLIPQYIDRKSKHNTIRKDMLREIYAYCRKLEALMKNNYRELAMSKTHVEYWYYCHSITSEYMKEKYYEKHLNSLSFAREIERRIGETKADFIGHVRKFQAVQKLKPEIENELDIISDLTNVKAKRYNASSLNVGDDLHEIALHDEIQLREKYYENLKYFKAINDYLQTQL